jgi:hypothetical protein
VLKISYNWLWFKRLHSNVIPTKLLQSDSQNVSTTMRSGSRCALRVIKLNGFRSVSTLMDITSNYFYKCTATCRTQICRKCLRLKLNEFRPVQTLVDITSNTFISAQRLPELTVFLNIFVLNYYTAKYVPSWKNQCYCAVFHFAREVGWVYIYKIYILYIYKLSRHSAAEHRASTRILHRTLFLASLLISARSF